MTGRHIVTICSSSRFYDQVRTVASELGAAGVTVHAPRFDCDERYVTITPEQKHELTTDFLEKMKESSLVYVIAGEGYTGRSVCIEIGFATGLGIPIIISEAPEEDAVGALVRAVVPAGSLVAYLRNRPAETI